MGAATLWWLQKLRAEGSVGVGRLASMPESPPAAAAAPADTDSRAPASAPADTDSRAPASRPPKSALSPPPGPSFLRRTTSSVSVWLHNRSRAKRESESHGPDAGPDLDQEMEKVFAVDDDKFDLKSICSPPDSDQLPRRSVSDRDFQHYRKKSYPHVYPPLKTFRRPSRQHMSPRPSISEENPPAEEEYMGSRRASDAPSSAMTIAASDEEVEEEKHVWADDDGEPQTSERAGAFDYTHVADPSRRVQFSIGDIPEDNQGPGLAPVTEGKEMTDADIDVKAKEERRSSRDDDPEKRKRKQRHHHHHGHHHRKLSLQEDLISRKRAGSEFLPAEIGRKSSIRPDEAAQLQAAVHVENLESHRFDDVRRYHKPQMMRGSSASVIRIGRKDGDHMEKVVPISDKKEIDHSPHEVFVQLDELSGPSEDREWQETARWIKYEEDVEEGLDRWGQPHVASLSFHSLLNLRRCLETGVVLLDLDEKDLPGVAYRVVEQMVVDELIDDGDRATVLRALLLRHRHVAEQDRFRFGVRRNFSSYASLQNLHDGKPRIVPSQTSLDNSSPKSKEQKLNGESHHLVDIKEEQTYTSSSEDLRKERAKESIMKKIPSGAEATTVLVGAVDFLEQPTIAFVRLAEGILMPSITEVAIPVRFMFILLGPPTVDLDYHEIGRSISTLMSNVQFHNVAYKAAERKELLSAINVFLDDSIVLPPGDWERKALLPFSELKAKSDAIRRRRNLRLGASGKSPGDDSKKALLADEKKPPRDDPLRRTRRMFGGLCNDLKRRYPFYLSDILDGVNTQVIAAAIFMYFAALSTAITFGGSMSDKTNNSVGIAETLVATSAAGIFFAVLAGQPLVIVGTTGPLLLFDESLFSFCQMYEINFLAMRLFIGFWLLVIALIVACLEGSVFVKLFTRFTEEIFASLISLLYIIESVQSMFFVYRKHPLLTIDEYCNSTEKNISAAFGIEQIQNDFANPATAMNQTAEKVIIGDIPDTQPNTALFCTILALGTFFIAYYLRQFRNSQFLGRSARRALGDFGVPLAIAIMVLTSYLNPQTYVEKLKVPDGLTPSQDSRGWLVSPEGVPLWMMFGACGPALLVYILIFMETNITELIIDKKERKLRKGSGFHLDIVLLCASNLGCGLIGAPWMCAATVRSIAHVSALTVMSTSHAPGASPHIVEVKEQRLSALLVATMIGLSVLMSSILRQIPKSVLFGVFLYMGISSTNGIQFFDRLKLLFMPVKHHSTATYVRRVPTMKMHIFTLIQLTCLVGLWLVKSSPISLGFPFFLIIMVPLRYQLVRIFSQSELRALDSDEVDLDPEEDEPDFYTEAPLPG